MPHDGSGWLDDWQAIEVDTGSVQRLAAALETEVRGNLEPHIGRVYQGYSYGTAFGTRSPSLELHAVRERYKDCLKGTVDQLAAYVEASTILVAAAAEIAIRYRTVDELASATVADVDRVLSKAVVAAGPILDFGHDVATAPDGAE
jgi:hypothetical protein